MGPLTGFAADVIISIHEPARVHELWLSPEDWAYYTVPQGRAADRRLHLPRGRVGGDRDAVVDPRLRVHGIDGLRVADASVMPVVTSGNTNAPSLMIGERAADFITGESPTAPPSSLAAHSAAF